MDGRIAAANAHIAHRVTPSGRSALGSHLLAAVRACNRYYGLKYVEGFTPIVEPPHRLIGTVIHTLLAYKYAEQLSVKPDWCSIPVQDAILQLVPNRTSALLDNAIKCFETYEGYFQGEALEPVSIEEQYGATVKEIDPDSGMWPELDDIVVTCRTDFVFRSNATARIIDIKCSAGNDQTQRLETWNPDGEYALNLQVFMNLLIVRLRLKEIVDGFFVRRIKRKRPFDFDTQECNSNTVAYEDARLAIRYMVREKVLADEAIALGMKPQPNFAACYGRFGPCDFAPLCRARTRIEQADILEKHYTIRGEDLLAPLKQAA